MEDVLSSLQKKDQVNLLTLPRSDLLIPTASPSLSKDDAENQGTGVVNTNTTTLKLLQLPPDWSPACLKDARFVMAPSSSDAADSNQPQPQVVSLVVESQKQSFDLHKVETSNALLLMAPLDANCQQQQQQRRKVTETGKILTTVPVRLLEKGGSGASFLEMRPRPLYRIDLGRALLQDNDRATATANSRQQRRLLPTQGRTVEELANTLQVSKHQVQQGLEQIHAFALPPRNDRDDNVRYCRLDEELIQSVNHAILAALMEGGDDTEDDFQDYASSDGVPLQSLVEKVAEILLADGLDLDEEEDDDDDMDDDHENNKKRLNHETALLLAKHCLKAFVKDGETMSRLSKRVRLDVSKVAACVARRLFQRQTAPWEETLFLSRWQSELPGVGNAYSVHTHMLRGIAVDKLVTVQATVQQEAEGTDADPNDDPQEEREERFWTYLPADQLPLQDPDACWKLLFAAKTAWHEDELEPYLEELADATHSTVAETLLRYTQVTTQQVHGMPIKTYHQR